MTIKTRVPVHISAYFVGMAALCLAAGPLWRMGLALGFAALHEAGHLLAMAAFGARPGRICLTAAGMRIERPPGLSLSFPQEIAIAFAGPAVSLLLAGGFALLARVIPLPSDLCLLNLGLPVTQKNQPAKPARVRWFCFTAFQSLAYFLSCFIDLKQERCSGVEYGRRTRKNYITKRFAGGDAKILFANFDTKKNESGQAEGSEPPI